MGSEERARATDLVTRMGAGERRAAADLMPLVYEQLRAQAGRYLAGRGAQATLQPTALVHEAFLQLVDKDTVPWQGRAHFCAIASKAMREILVDHVRAKCAQKRGAGWNRITLQGIAADARAGEVELLALHGALERLAALDAEQASLVELRFFGGLTLREIEGVTGMPRSTIERRLAVAQAWLLREIDREGET